MITFFVCLALLLIGYATYGAFVEKVFHPDDRETPCTRLEDGVDYAPIAPWRAFLIQLLNIAGLGPIFGALSGAIWGPSYALDRIWYHFRRCCPRFLKWYAFHEK